MTHTHPMRLLAAALLALVLTACGGGGGEGGTGEPAETVTVTEPASSDSLVSETPASSSPEPVESSPPPPPANAEYGTVEELRDAAVAAGYPCRNWKKTNKLTFAASSGNCRLADVFAVYATESDRDAQIDAQRAFTKEFDMKLATVLVGPNWTINSPNADALRQVLGGVIFGG